MDQATILSFIYNYGSILDFPICGESDLERALSGRNDALLISLVSALTCALVGRQKPLTLWSEVDKHLLPAVRARRDRLLPSAAHRRDHSASLADLAASSVISEQEQAQLLPAGLSFLKWTSEEKTRILCSICDWLVEELDDFREASTRIDPMGRDHEGNSYWYFDDGSGHFRIHKLNIRDASWSIGCDTKEEMEVLAACLSSAENNASSKSSQISKESNSGLSKSNTKRKSGADEEDSDDALTGSAAGGTVDDALKLGNYLTSELIPYLERKSTQRARAQSRASRIGLDLGNIVSVSERPRRAASANAKYTFDFDDEFEQDKADSRWSRSTAAGSRRSSRFQQSDEEDDDEHDEEEVEEVEEQENEEIDEYDEEVVEEESDQHDQEQESEQEQSLGDFRHPKRGKSNSSGGWKSTITDPNPDVEEIEDEARSIEDSSANPPSLNTQSNISPTDAVSNETTPPEQLSVGVISIDD